MSDASTLPDNDEVLTIARQLRIAYQLKRTLRYGTKRDMSVHSKSVAEHIYGLMILAEYFHPLETAARPLDLLHIFRLILFHEFGEIPRGDVPLFQKTKRHTLEEQADARLVFRGLPKLMRQLGHPIWFEAWERESPTAHFVHALDKTEPVFEFFDPINERSVRRLGQTYEQTCEPKFAATDRFPVMRRFVEVLLLDMKNRGVFCD